MIITPFFSSTFWALSVGIFHFRISRPSKFNFMGFLLTLHLVMVCKIHTYMPRMTLLTLLTNISFFYVTFTNVWCIKCFLPSMIPIWPWSHDQMTNPKTNPKASIFKSNMSDHFSIFCTVKKTLSVNSDKTKTYKQKFSDGTMNWNNILSNDINKSNEKYTMLPFQKWESK